MREAGHAIGTRKRDRQRCRAEVQGKQPASRYRLADDDDG